MFPLFESLCVLDGQILHPHWHEERYHAAFQHYYGTPPKKGLLEGIIIPNPWRTGMVKLRISYNEYQRELLWSAYVISEIKSLQAVSHDVLEYGLKFNDRKQLNALYEKRGGCDDILILKSGWITDTSYGNLAFLKEGLWYTPEQPLLPGTCRARLIAEEKLIPTPIYHSDLKQFSAFKVINAMRDLEAVGAAAIENIFI
ncbi:aminotransferase class IV [Flavobacteriaceae bacterium]|nr:aminotransferase class IV [Flavobacteriaceae bacterium]